MQYSYWSGKVQGLEEKASESFVKDPSFGNALKSLAFCLKVRQDFLYFKRRGMVDGKLTPFDINLIKNIFVGLRNSMKG